MAIISAFPGKAKPKLQAKTVSPSTVQQTIKPDSTHEGLSQVTVNAMRLQSKTITPSGSQQIVTPDSGYNGLNKVTVAGVTDAYEYYVHTINSTNLSSVPIPIPEAWRNTKTYEKIIIYAQADMSGNNPSGKVSSLCSLSSFELTKEVSCDVNFFGLNYSSVVKMIISSVVDVQGVPTIEVFKSPTAQSIYASDKPHTIILIKNKYN